MPRAPKHCASMVQVGQGKCVTFTQRCRTEAGVLGALYHPTASCITGWPPQEVQGVVMILSSPLIPMILVTSLSLLLPSGNSVCEVYLEHV